MLRKQRFGQLACLLWFGLAVLSARAEQPVDALTSVQETTDVLRAKLVEVQPLYETDQEKFFSEVESSLAPFIDFEGFSRGVMAKYYRRATPEQQAQFALVFRKGLIRTYGKALIEFDNQRVEVVPSSSESARDNRAAVDLLIYSEGDTVYTVNYSLVLLDGVWKLRNVTIEGINIGLQFRSQFAAYMDKYKNDIDAVIANWSVDV